MRTMQMTGGFLRENTNGDWSCTRAETLHGAITCPEGHYKITEDDFEKTCNLLGAKCPEGLSCFCEPCIKAFEVDLYEYTEDITPEQEKLIIGCDKMSLCASVQQTKTITFHAYDNIQRPNADIKAIMHIGAEVVALDVFPATNTYWTYEFSFTYHQIGIGILEFYINNAQIQQSPMRVQVRFVPHLFVN